MCDVTSVAVFCSESIKYLPGLPPKIFLKLLVTILVAPIITGINYYYYYHHHHHHLLYSGYLYLYS